MKKYLFLLPAACLAFAGCNEPGGEDKGTPVDKGDETALAEFATKVGNGVKASYDGLKTGVEAKLEVSLKDVAFHMSEEGLNYDITSESLGVTVEAKAINLDKDSSKWEASVVVSTKGSVSYEIGTGVGEAMMSGSLDVNGISVASYLKDETLYVDLTNEKLGELSTTAAGFIATDPEELQEISAMIQAILVKSYIPDFMYLFAEEPITIPELPAEVPAMVSGVFVEALEEAKEVEGLYESIQLLTFEDGGFGVAIPTYTVSPDMGETDTLVLGVSASVNFNKDGLLKDVNAAVSVDAVQLLSETDSISLKGAATVKLETKFGITDAGIPALDEYTPLAFF